MSTGYNNKGLYNAYDKKNKERQAEDYYSTPTEEVTNILNILNLNFDGQTILEPSCGGGHMVNGIINYLNSQNITNYKIIATDIKDRLYRTENPNIETIYNQDFFADEYGESFPSVDYIIMNPPYSVIEPFVIRALEIPKKGVLMLGRLQFLEGQNRYATIFQKNPPSDVYIYVDRIACFKNGDTSKKMDSAQAYAWFYFDIEKMKTNKTTEVHWIRRIDKS
jgi:predicted RNA methylase